MAISGFQLEHAELIASYTELREFLLGLHLRFIPLGDTDYFQHHYCAERVESLALYLDSAFVLAAAHQYPAGLAVCRSALEHLLVDHLLFLADRYRLRLRDFPRGEFERLRSAKANGDEEAVDILDIGYDDASSTMTITRTGVHAQGGDRGEGARSLSIYYRVIDDFDPFRISRASRPYVGELIELPDEVVDRQLRDHANAWHGNLRWEAIKDNLVMNEIIARRQAAHFDVHYSFLSAYSHPVSPRALAEIHGHNARGYHVAYDHYASELILLYVVSLAVRELEAFGEMAKREPRVRLRAWEIVDDALLRARERSSHLWLPKDDPPMFDREDEAVSRNREGGVPRPVTLEQVEAVALDEVRYYSNPLVRLRRLHAQSRGYPWLLYSSPWPRGDFHGI